MFINETCKQNWNVPSLLVGEHKALVKGRAGISMRRAAFASNTLYASVDPGTTV